MDASDKMKINIVDFEDWTVIYVDDKARGGDHRMDAGDMLEILGIDFEQEFIDGWDYDKEIPDNYSELKRIVNADRT